MKKWTALLLLALLLMNGAVALAYNILPAESTLYKNVHLRENPSTEARSKMILKKGTKIIVVDIIGGWAYVRYGSNTGYIRGDLIVDDSKMESPNVVPEIEAPSIQLGIRSVLKEGMRGEEVRALQDALILLGYIEIKADGVFGELTRVKVCEFQRMMGLRVDGVVGSDTLDALTQAITGMLSVG